MPSVSSYHLDVIETDSESELQQPLDASSPHNDKSGTNTSTNQPAKRYFLIQRPDSNMTQVMHVWGPSKIRTQDSIPLRTAADHEATNHTGGPNPSSQVRMKQRK